MELAAFLERVIDDGIAAARLDYANDPDKLQGAVRGFEACRGKDRSELATLLAAAHERLRDLRRAGDMAHYWEHRCYEAEIEWVCNVVSAALFNEGKPTIVAPTARGMLKAADILGVRATAGASP